MPASARAQLFQGEGANRVASVVQVLFGLALVGFNAYYDYVGWSRYGPGRPKPPLYGIWNVDEMSIDGKVRSPLLTDYDRWRRLIFDFPNTMNFQRMDDSICVFVSKVDLDHRTVTLTKSDDKKWNGQFSFDRQGSTQMTIDGEMDHHAVHMKLQMFDLQKFLLVSRGFHWVQDRPFNR